MNGVHIDAKKKKKEKRSYSALLSLLCENATTLNTIPTLSEAYF